MSANELIDRRASENGGDIGAQRKVEVVEMKHEEVTLYLGENAGKSLVMKPDEIEFLKSEELYLNFWSILNKLTLRNWQRVASEVIALPIDTEERLRVIVNIAFEKIVNEHSFIDAGAKLFRSISPISVGWAGKQGKDVDFRKLILTRCQREFEKFFSGKDLDTADTEETLYKYNSFISKAHYRSIGNVRLIGQLFKCRMLSEAIMHDCIVRLIKHNQDDSLEYVCHLLRAIGKSIDHEKAKPRIDQYFKQIRLIISWQKASAKVRIMLQDVADLRENKWVPADGSTLTITESDMGLQHGYGATSSVEHSVARASSPAAGQHT